MLKRVLCMTLALCVPVGAVTLAALAPQAEVDPAHDARQDVEKRVKALENEVRNLKLMLLFSWYYCADGGFQQKVGYPHEQHFPFLGVSYEYVSKETSETFGLSEGEGVKVKVVGEDTPAAKAGLREGDLLLRVNGTPIKSGGLFGQKPTANWVTMFLPGETPEFEYVRKGEKKKVSITLTCKADGDKCFFWNSSGVK